MTYDRYNSDVAVTALIKISNKWLVLYPTDMESRQDLFCGREQRRKRKLLSGVNETM